MIEAAATKIFMMGLPESGKTTYLAALFNTVRTPGSTSQPVGFALEDVPGDLAYFHEIERTWLDLQPMVHSLHSEPKNTALILHGTDGMVDVAVPDVSGETFNQLWETGAWVDSVQSLAREADGILLFVRSDSVRTPNLLEPPPLLETGSVDGDAIDQPETELDDEELRALHLRSAQMAPTQTKLADLLEIAWDQRAAVRVAVVVSAWDVVEGIGLSPKRWLELNVPLLWQMLVSQSDRHAWRAFGVSAQGGDVTDDAVRVALAAVTPPNDRIIVVDERATSDITLPVQWLLSR